MKCVHVILTGIDLCVCVCVDVYDARTMIVVYLGVSIGFVYIRD